MFNKNNFWETKSNPAGVSFHELTIEEMLLTSGGNDDSRSLITIATAASSKVCASAAISAVGSAAGSAVSGVFSHRYC